MWLLLLGVLRTNPFATKRDVAEGREISMPSGSALFTFALE